MKRTKKILIFALSLFMGVLNMATVNAANNRIEIIEPAKQYLFKNSSEDIVAKLRHEVTASDLVKGDLTVNLTFDNSLNTEIIYVIDNGTSISTYKANVMDSLALLTADLFESFESNIKIGSVISTSGENTTKDFTTTVTETTNNLDALEEVTAAGTSDLYSALAEANSTFSSDATNKIILLITAGMPEHDETDVNSFISLGDSINIITLTLDLADNAEIANVFGTEATPKTGTLINATTENYQTKITEDVVEEIEATKPTTKSATSIVMPFAQYIISNFDIELITTTGVTMDETTKEITWNLGDVLPNEVKTLQYTLSLKSAVDESILNTNLTLNEAPTIIFNSINIPRTDVNNCSPIIKVLQEAIDNPKTGVVSYVIFGSILAATGGITYILATKKQKFNTL